jgi:hypothetical protein
MKNGQCKYIDISLGLHKLSLKNMVFVAYGWLRYKSGMQVIRQFYLILLYFMNFEHENGHEFSIK